MAGGRTFGQIGAFSFHPRKSLTTGEGGMLTTASEQIDERARSLREHGAAKSDLARHGERRGFLLSDFEALGYNYRMTDIQGALGCAQMERAGWILDAAGGSPATTRRSREPSGSRRLSCPRGTYTGTSPTSASSVPKKPSLERLDELSERRDLLMLRMADRGIATRQGTHAAALTGYYSDKYGLSREQFPNAAVAERLSITLALYPDMSEADQELVIGELVSAYEAA